MSYWISRRQCNNCGSEVNVTGGIINTTWMGPASLTCPNPDCAVTGFDNFTTIVPNIDFITQPQYREFTIRNNQRSL